MRFAFAFILAATLPVAPANADSPVITDQVYAGIGGSYAWLQQHGIGNTARLDQTDGAVAVVSQIGNGNTIGLHQTIGDSLTSTQIGNGLGYTIEQSPNAGHVTITQHR
jgi:hypothetical protein